MITKFRKDVLYGKRARVARLFWYVIKTPKVLLRKSTANRECARYALPKSKMDCAREMEEIETPRFQFVLVAVWRSERSLER